MEKTVDSCPKDIQLTSSLRRSSNRKSLMKGLADSVLYQSIFMGHWLGRTNEGKCVQSRMITVVLKALWSKADSKIFQVVYWGWIQYFKRFHRQICPENGLQVWHSWCQATPESETWEASYLGWGKVKYCSVLSLLWTELNLINIRWIQLPVHFHQ